VTLCQTKGIHPQPSFTFALAKLLCIHSTRPYKSKLGRKYRKVRQEEFSDTCCSERQPRNRYLLDLDTRVDAMMEQMNFRGAMDACMEALREGNRLFDEAKPWQKNTEPQAREQILSHTLETVRCVATALQPMIPQTADRILTALGVPKDRGRSSADIRFLALNDSLVGNNLSDFDSFLVYNKQRRD
jgi:methionyl-tRNA synthetase